MPKYKHVVDDFMQADRILGVTDIVGGAEAIERVPRDIAWWWAGIPITALSGGADFEIHVQVQRAFRPRRLVLADLVTTSQDNLGAARVMSIKIGNREQIINSSPVNGAAFARDAYATLLRGDTAQPGVGIDLRIQHSGSPNFSLGGAFFGEAAY